MKKTAVLFLAAAAGTAQAEPSVTLYGIVDAALVGERGGVGNTPVKVSSGAASTSRLGFRGAEDLGGGLSAFFTLETGTRIDTGELDAANTLFNRQAFVGLKGRFGSVALGRQYTPYHLALVAFDPFKTGYAGTVKSLFPDWGTNVRTSNTVTWKSPKVHGVDGELAYSSGEQRDASSGRQFGGAIGYAGGPLAVRLVYNSKNTDVAPGGTAAPVNHTLGRNTLLAATYELPRVKLHLLYGVDKGDGSTPLPNANNPYGGVKPTPSTDGRDLLLGVSAPLGNGTLMASTMRKDDRSRFNQDATSWGVGYLYNLSRRTGLYAAYAHIDNRNGAGYTVANNSESGTGSTGVNLGVRHTF